MIRITSAREDPRSRRNLDIGEVEFAGGMERAKPASRIGCPGEAEGDPVRGGTFVMLISGAPLDCGRVQYQTSV
jgi:hypothetical protein